MKSTAHPAAILPTTGYTEHVDAKTHPALLALHATSPTLFPMILWGLLFLFSSSSSPPPCIASFTLLSFLFLPLPLSLLLLLSEDCRAPEASSRALGQTLIKTAC